MERKTFSKAKIYVRESYNRAGKLAEKGDYAAAVEILLPVIKANPDVPQLFERIREYEMAWDKKKNVFIKKTSSLNKVFSVGLSRVGFLSENFFSHLSWINSILASPIPKARAEMIPL